MIRTPVVNPVFSRELRQRMRGPRASTVLTLYLLVLSLIVWALYEGVSRSSDSFRGPDVEQIAGLGRSVFQTLLFCVLLLVCFIVPGLTAGAIAGERERQTLVPLQVTLLRSRSILFGKLLASLAFVVLLIIATLPLAGVSFLLGGVEPWEVARGTGMVVIVAAFLACLSLLCSSLVRRTQGATVLAYGMVLALVLGTWVVYGTQVAFSGGRSVRNLMVLQFNPMMAVADVLDDSDDITNGGGGISPFSPMQALLRERQSREPLFNVAPAPVEINGRIVDQPARAGPRQLGLSRVPFFVYSLLAFAGMSAGSIWWAARRLAVPKAAP